jgi:hypothetical protein
MNWDIRISTGLAVAAIIYGSTLAGSNAAHSEAGGSGSGLPERLGIDGRFGYTKPVVIETESSRAAQN